MRLFGLILDVVAHHGGGHMSAWSELAPDIGVARFTDGQWLVTLPMGSGISDSLTSALELAKGIQRANLRDLGAA